MLEAEDWQTSVHGAAIVASCDSQRLIDATPEQVNKHQGH
jgi:hypothetical protein